MQLGEETIQTVDLKLKEDLKKELRDQGHYLTGALEESIESRLSNTPESVAVDMYAEDYLGGTDGNGGPLNNGVPAANIPYNPDVRSGAGTSKYIEGLKRYAMLRFGLVNEAEALKAAFAIARKHKREGMPTKDSYAFAVNGRRKKALETAFEGNQFKYDKEIEQGIDKELDKIFDSQSFDVTII